MSSKCVHLVVGARPNFMKAAPLYRALREEEDIVPMLIHTGQHYDYDMYESFFADLHMPRPNVNFEVGAANRSAAGQIGDAMQKYDAFCAGVHADLVVVFGDVNSTLAGALVASKRGIPCAHVEAGLRSGDRLMPEEINRILVDNISDYLFAPLEKEMLYVFSEETNLTRRMFYVGNIMIDSLVYALDKLDSEPRPGKTCFASKEYGVVTLHRPSNVDDPKRLRAIMDSLQALADTTPLIFPIHPRTKARIDAVEDHMGMKSDRISFCPPMTYLNFIDLIRDAKFVLTDSGGIQEETTFLKIPCITLRETTERPITLKQLGYGSNILCPDLETAMSYARDEEFLSGDGVKDIPLWDGKTAERIVRHIKDILKGEKNG